MKPGKQTLAAGLHETLITREVASRLAELDERLVVDRQELAAAEAPDRIALHLARTLARVIESKGEETRSREGIALARELIARIAAHLTDADALLDQPIEPASVLRSLSTRRPDGSPDTPIQPLTPLLDTTLLTNAPGEPRVGSQVLAEIGSADRIDVVMAFIRNSGLMPLHDALRRHVARGRPLRVLTTTYTGSTERAALDRLAGLGAQVRVSYDTTSTRLHAKAWLFYRESGFSTAFVGSSNLTHSAQVAGLEWNVRVAGARNPDVLAKIGAVFEAYWQSGDFVAYDAAEFDARTSKQAGAGPQLMLSPLEIRPEPFQARLLELLRVARRQGRHRNLLVAATGTGKTVMAALDYADLRSHLPRARLLFVAHRQEILEQARATFAQALREPAFGELWVGGHRPHEFEHVFASIQSLSQSRLDDLPADHFDVVIVDEFHHAAAESYRRLLEHVRPCELLGLTATPERADGLPVLDWFEGRIAAELRLWDAIDQQFLCPFRYFGIHDGLDLRQVPWRRGTGYDVEGLTGVYTANDAWARLVVKELIAHADAVDRVRALGFCVSIVHARYMARIFNDAGITAVAIFGESSDQERREALAALRDGSLRVLFSVDLFNEGVDLPVVDALLLLRPTDSATLFLQQLGRGLRKSAGKASCLVLDFVGVHRREFRFDRRLRALLGGTRKDLTTQVEQGFPLLPAGCHMQLDRVAAEIVLRSIRSAVPSNWTQQVDELRALIAGGKQVSLESYLEHSGVELHELYAGGRSWSDLRAAAGLALADAGPHEVVLRRAIGRLLHVDDDERIDTWREWLTHRTPPDASRLDLRARRLLHMLVAQLVDQVPGWSKATPLQQGVDQLWRHPQVRAELLELCPILGKAVDHLGQSLTGRPDVPLWVHARYSRLEILAAFGSAERLRVGKWQSGVQWLPEERVDLLAFTLDKTGGSFSPTTRYRDHAISRDLIHWESQSVTRADGDTGRRYQGHAALGSEVLLFARLRPDDRAFWLLGPAGYVSHAGERPMAITWRLTHALPGDLYVAFAAAVA